MELERLRRWVWVVVGAALGTLLGEVRRVNPPDLASSYGEPIGGQQEFEAALTREVGGAKCFRSLTVYPETLAGDGGSVRMVHVVRGLYNPGKPEHDAAGRPVTAWRPRCFVAEVPYGPPGEDPGVVAAGAALPTVLARLDALRRQGVTYRYAWWCEPRWSLVAWAAGGAVGVGLFGSSLVYLLAYGSIFPPPAPSWVWLARRPRPGDARRSADDAAAALAAAIGYADALEAQLTADAVPRVTPPQSADAAPASKPLTPGPQQASPPPTSDLAGAEFGARPDDFYPTELKAPQAEPPACK